MEKEAYENAETIDDHTAVATPERTNSVTKRHRGDVEKQIVKPQQELSTPIEIPDGGWTAWLTVLGAWCMLFTTFGMTSAFGVYQDFYVRFFLPSSSPSTIGWIGSTQLFFQFFMGIPAGLLFDKGYFHRTTCCASILYILASYMLSLTHHDTFYQVFLTQGVAAGIGLGFVFLPSVGVISHHFKNRRAFAMGIVTSGSGCGGLVFPIMVNKLIISHGFEVATRSVAYLTTGMLAIGVLLMRTRLTPRSKGDVATQPPLPSVKDLLTDAKYMIAAASAFFCVLGLFSPIFYIQLYAVVHGVDQNLAFYTITILNGASVIGRIIPNFASDRWGPFNTIIPCTFACIVIQFSMLAATNAGGIVAIAILYGFFSGAYISLISPLVASLSNSLAEVGMRMGVSFTMVAFSALAGMPIAGALLTEKLIWSRLICFSASCMVVGLILSCISRHLTVRLKGTWRV